MRTRCQAVLLDAGGVIVLPDGCLVRDALAEAGIAIRPDAVPAAHYRAVRTLDRDRELRKQPDGYVRVLCTELGVAADRLGPAATAFERLGDREASGVVLWSEPIPGAHEAIEGLMHAGVAVVVVTNSDGHAAENLRDAGICQTGPGRGATVSAVIDSVVVGSAKPDPEIFRIALRHAGARTSGAVHIGDMLSADIEGASAAGIAAIHLDPARRCRCARHRHLRSLRGVWRHVAAS
jgi:putative hydrolase of the HAD superfamily